MRFACWLNKVTDSHSEYVILFFFFLQRYGCFSLALASLIIDAYSCLFNAFVLFRFTASFLKSSSTSFIHLSLGRPLRLLPSNFPSKIFFTDLVSFILLTCPSRSSLRIFITVTISWDLYLILNSSLVLILHCPFSFVGPYILLSIFLSHVINIFFSFTCQRSCLCSICHSWSYDRFVETNFDGLGYRSFF